VKELPDTAPVPNVEAKYVRKALMSEIAFRRERRQQVFSWANSLQVAITGGTIALTFKEGRSLAFNQKIILTIAIGILLLDAGFWIGYHWGVETKARKEVDPLNIRLGIPAVSKTFKADWPSMLALLLFTGAAVAAVWVPI